MGTKGREIVQLDIKELLKMDSLSGKSLVKPGPDLFPECSISHNFRHRVTHNLHAGLIEGFQTAIVDGRINIIAVDQTQHILRC